MSTETDRLIADYLAGPARLRSVVEGMTHEQLVARPVAGKWSTLEVVCHLVDSEIAYVHRMRRVIAEDRPLLIGYHETKFAEALGYNSRDLNAELALFAALRSGMAQTLGNVPVSAWSREGVHNERGIETLADLVRIEADHVVHHVGTINEKRVALGLALVG